MKKPLTIFTTLIFVSTCSCTKGQSGFLGPDLALHSSVIMIAGESNASGSANNTTAPVNEIGVRPSVKILNNDNLTIETLNIGVNNVTGYPIAYPQYHGWELGIANIADSGLLPNPVYIVKTAYSGTTISQWAVGQPHYIDMIARMDTMINVRKAQNKNTPPDLYMLYSQGINDYMANTDLTVWKNATKAHFANIRARYGRMPIFITYLPPAYGTYNPVIDAICNEISECYAIETTDLTTGDGLHWGYPGMKIIASRMITAIKAHYTFR